MEQVPPARRGRRVRFLATAVGLLIAVTALAWLGLHRVAPARLMAPGAPRINLTVAVVERGQPAPPSVAPPPTPTANGETELFPWRHPTPTSEPAERSEQIEVTRVPVAISVYVLDGPALLEWIDENPAAQRLLGSELVQGMFQDVLRTLHVRSQDLKVPGVEGTFLVALARDMVSAGAVLHYDHVRGRRGYVLAFDRARAPLAGRLLPLVVAAVGKREYRILDPSLSVVELVLGPQRLFVTDAGGTIYIAASLPALLNVIANAPAPPAEANGTFAVRLRAEAWLRDLLPAMAGTDHFDVTWSVDVHEPASPGEIRSSPAALYRTLQPALAEGVLASLPHDAFAALAASVPLPRLQPSERGARSEADADANAAGIGVVWDLANRDGLDSDVGLAAAARGDDASAELAAFVSDDAFSGTCAGGTIWLAASSELLLTRMTEACERQSVSVLDGMAAAGRRPLPQLVLSIAPTGALNEVLTRGIGTAKQARANELGGNADPAWKRSYDAAVDHARDSATATLATIPAVLFQGSAGPNGARLTGAFEPPRQLARQFVR